MATQTHRLVSFLLSHPEATSLEVTMACGIVNVTGRVSDARKAGVVIDCGRRSDGQLGYTIREATPGVARFDGRDSKAQVERKMAEAFAPVTAMRKAWQDVFGDDL